MDVVGLAFTLFGHLLASVLYIWRRIPFSTSGDAVDRSSILENKDQLRQLWERRVMADEQSQAALEQPLAPNSGTEEVKAKHENKKATIIQNGNPTVCTGSEGPDKGDPSETHNGDATNCASTDLNHKDPVSVSETTEVLTNGSDPSTETNKADHVGLLETENSQGKDERDDITKEEKVPEEAQVLSCDSVATESDNNCLSDDQKAGTVSVQEKNETDHPSQDKGETDHPSQDKGETDHPSQDKGETDHPSQDKGGLTDKEKEVDTEEETRPQEMSDCTTEVLQVPDDTEERLNEPDTETYYTSNFTFVCQKSHEEEEQQSEEPGEVEFREILEAEVVMESAEITKTAGTQSVETFTCDDNNNSGVASESCPNEAPELSVGDASCPPCSENPENALDSAKEAVECSQLSYEHSMTSDFPEMNDDEADLKLIELTNDKKSENESEVEVEVYNKLNNNITDAEGDLPSLGESTIENNDGELKEGKIERPSHFVRLKRTGVQKTERPYDSGTTESKIAMEIREMREREEELRLMRERMQSPEGSIRSSSSSPLLSPASPSKLSQGSTGSPELGPGYRVSTVFGNKASPVQSPVEEEKKAYRSFSKESAVEKEIRIAKNREEELRKEKGLPPREDDSYIKPSQVKSSQVRVFGRMNSSNTSKELATTKIQQEIEEQTLREMALREKGHIQTISQERTDSKVAKLKDLDVSVPECTSPLSPNGHGPLFSDRSSKRSTPSPTGSSHGSIPPVSPRPVSQGKGISMQKFIASKGKETTFIASRNGPSHPEQNADASRSNPVMRKVKRTVSVESKIQQEILEMKLREEELRRMHNSSSTDQPFLTSSENGTDLGSATNEVSDYINGQEINGNDDCGPSSNNLIAQWEQRIQKAEGRA